MGLSRASKNLLHYNRAAGKLHPLAAEAGRVRKKYGDGAAQPILDALITSVKRRRESRANDISMGY
jgi:hypothetical protein